MQENIICIDKNQFPTLTFWKELPTNSLVHWKNIKTNEINIEKYSHVATDTVYFYTKEGFIMQKISYDSDSSLQDFYDESEFPIKIELSNQNKKNYVLIPTQFFDKIIKDFHDKKIKLYDDYMDQGWGEIENIDYLYIENCDNTISYINGEGVWILYEDMLEYDPNFEELFGMSLCEIDENYNE